jgi:ketosteroid isomerase-like protein
MHPNGVLLQRLFTALDRHDHSAMGPCYQPTATFHDIAFDLEGRQRILAMWHMICEGSDIRVTFEAVHANDQDGRVALVDEYTFGDTGRKVRNVIDSRFRFNDGLIVEHRDFCDAPAWASMAIGGVSGLLAGRIRLLRSLKANKKLDSFVRAHSEYR